MSQSVTVISKTEERGITILQLRGVMAQVEATWRSWGDVEFGSGKTVASMDEINLHNVNGHIIVPRTKAYRCSYVELVATGPQPPQWFISQ